MLKVSGEKDKPFTLALHKFVKKSKLIWEIINSDTYDAKSLHGALSFCVVKIDKACRIYPLHIYSIKFINLHYNY